MARADRDITDVPVDVVQTMRDCKALSKGTEIMVVDTNPLLRVQLARTEEVADHLFFFTSMLMTGLPCS